MVRVRYRIKVRFDVKIYAKIKFRNEIISLG